jgi:hypothetical protein
MFFPDDAVRVAALSEDRACLRLPCKRRSPKAVFPSWFFLVTSRSVCELLMRSQNFAVRADRVTGFRDEPLSRKVTMKITIYRAPKSWTERAYHKLIYLHEVDKGGHFAAWEQPELLPAEMRVAFKSLR